MCRECSELVVADGMLKVGVPIVVVSAVTAPASITIGLAVVVASPFLSMAAREFAFEQLAGAPAAAVSTITSIAQSAIQSVKSTIGITTTTPTPKGLGLEDDSEYELVDE